METLWWVIGGAGQACFMGRFAVQWLVSEKKRESVIPGVFWILSLVGCVLLLAWCLYREDPPLIVLQLVNFGIYVRNLMLLRSEPRPGASLRLIGPLVGIAALAAVAAALGKFDWDVATIPWLVCGFIGQCLWNSRFIIQWIYSERRGRSSMPVAFWWVSLVGDVFLLAYSVYRRDPIIIIGFLFNPVIYIRNLVLIARKRREAAAAPAGEPV